MTDSLRPAGRPQREVLNLTEAADFLRISVRSFAILVESGVIRGAWVTPGRRVFRIDALRRYVKKMEK